MTVLTTLAIMMLAMWAASFYLRKSLIYLRAAEPAWERLYSATMASLSDSAMPEKAVSFAVAATMCTGCGCLTTQALLDSLMRKFKRKSVFRRDAMLETMTTEQRERFDAVVINAMYYDSLRVPFRGFLARRLVFPWLRQAAEGTDKLALDMRASTLAKSSRKAIESRPEGRKLLVHSH